MRILVFSDIHGGRGALDAVREQEADLYIAAGDLVSWGRGLDSLAPALHHARLEWGKRLGKAMRILVFSDIHGDRGALDALMEQEADLYIAAGDLVSWGRGLDLLAPALQRRAPRVWVLPGNHEHESDIETFCQRHKLNPLHGRHFEMDGWRIAGLGYSSPTPFNTPGEYTEEEFRERLARFSGLKPLILVCHCPPVDTALDRAAFGRHIGSSAVREFLDREQPAWFACGHVHEAAGVVTQLGSTRAVNAGKNGYLIEIPPVQTDPRGSTPSA